MPDLTLTPYWHCKSGRYFETTIESSSGNGEYIVSFDADTPPDKQWRCECKGWQFRRRCRHISIAKKELCGWTSKLHEGEVTDGACPRCGGEVESLFWAE